MECDIEELKFRVVGCAIAVSRTLGVGFQEAVYSKSLAVELTLNSIPFEREVRVPVYYKNQCVGDYVADFVVDGRLILELKAVSCLLPLHEVQLVNYLTATKIDDGMLLNFGEIPLGKRSKKRVYLPNKK